MITAIFATRNDEVDLALALSPLVPAAVEGVVKEVIVVDFGSRDGTLTVAETAGCDILEASGNEGLARAARGAKSDWLLFLSPGAVLDPNWQNEALAFIDQAMLSGAAASAAATFRHARPDRGFRARFAEWCAVMRSGGFAAPYDEQGLLISAALYRSVGGHRAMPAMADVDLARRIGRRRLTLLRTRAVVRHPKRGGEGFMRGARNAACLAMFVLRLPPSLIARLAA
ncbi:MAG: glycosyltransferase [Bauldia sp.]|uniref:glycosyltransferase n=1 Tax=Bauldia sp. TaxID=2575872 RepID=UPI001DC93851|nr:glycosyltransferase [Bauldia sp.]MCB1494391.1 glycosyltransferase [Bauldia sp.]